MNQTRIPGNKPDPGDMATDADSPLSDEKHEPHDLPDDDAESLGNFA